MRAAFLLLAFAATTAFAQPAGEFTPNVGQPGKDVIWVPTPEGLVDRMLRMARVNSSDFVIDLGAGDGRIAIAAAKNFRARARGVEFNPDMVALSRRNAEAAGVQVEFVQGDIFQTDFSEATVITMYLLPSLNIKLRPQLLELKPGTRIVSHAFDMGDWDADETSGADRSLAYLWIVPGAIAGTWRLEHAGRFGNEIYELTLRQKYQRLEGNVRRGNRLSPVSGILNGDRFRFVIADAEEGDRVFVGRVAGSAMAGTTRSQGGTDVVFKASMQ